MRVLVASAAFKGTLSPQQATAAIAAGWRTGDHDADVVCQPIADGGEGTLDVLLEAMGGDRRTITVSGPLGDPVTAMYGVTTDGGLAVVEAAQASGLGLVSEARRDPLRASTRGTGEVLLAACRDRPSRVLVAVGGSATTDGGAGMAQALGVHLLDGRGREIGPGGRALADAERIDVGGLDRSARDMDIVAACDVGSPLLGPLGAAVAFGPQKGATPEQVAELEAGLGHLAFVIRRDLGIDVRDLPGAGAGGGLGAGLAALVGAKLRSGADLVFELLGMAERVAACDVVVTGEGRFDRTSLAGKAPWSLVRLAREAGKRWVVLCGEREDGMNTAGGTVAALVDRVGAEEARREPERPLAALAEEVAGAGRG